MPPAPLATNVTMSASVQCLFCQQETRLSRGEAAIEEHLSQVHSVARSRGLLTSLHLLTLEEVGDLTQTLRPRLEELKQRDIQSLPQDEGSNAEQAESEQNEDKSDEDKELADIQMLLMPSDSESDDDEDQDRDSFDDTLDPENDPDIISHDDSDQQCYVYQGIPWSVAAGGRDANPNHFL